MIIIVKIKGHKKAVNLESGTAVKQVTKKLQSHGFEEISLEKVETMKNQQFTIIN